MIVAERDDVAESDQDEPVQHASGVAPDGSEWCLAGCGPWPCLPSLGLAAPE